MTFFGETEITDIPAYAHNRFGIRHELAFKFCVSWVATMTHVSMLRLNDPQCDANLLLQNTLALRNKVCRSFAIALGVKHATMSELMRHVWHTEGFCSVHQRDATIDTHCKCLRKIETLGDGDLTGTLKELQTLFGEEKSAALQAFWDRGAREREMVFGQAKDPEFTSCVQHFFCAQPGT
jgi:hypothetical protein